MDLGQDEPYSAHAANGAESALLSAATAAHAALNPAMHTAGTSASIELQGGAVVVDAHVMATETLRALLLARGVDEAEHSHDKVRHSQALFHMPSAARLFSPSFLARHHSPKTTLLH